MDQSHDSDSEDSDSAAENLAVSDSYDGDVDTESLILYYSLASRISPRVRMRTLISGRGKERKNTSAPLVSKARYGPALHLFSSYTVVVIDHIGDLRRKAKHCFTTKC